MSNIEPIKRSELGDSPVEFWPETIEAFNYLIKQNWDGNKAKFTQDDVVGKILDLKLVKATLKVIGIVQEELFRTHQLDVEKLYREQGFTVIYDKPAYNELYPATFTFK